MCTCTHATGHMWKSEGSLWELVFPCHYVSPRDWTQVSGLYLLNDPGGTVCRILLILLLLITELRAPCMLSLDSATKCHISPHLRNSFYLPKLKPCTHYTLTWLPSATSICDSTVCEFDYSRFHMMSVILESYSIWPFVLDFMVYSCCILSEFPSFLELKNPFYIWLIDLSIAPELLLPFDYCV